MDRLVIRKRTESAWERARVAPVRANSLVSDARARGLLQCAIHITKPVREPGYALKAHYLPHRIFAL
jgi:hypothetical protein